MFTGRETRYHQLVARVVTDRADHQKVSIEVRDGVAKVRTGAKVVEERAGVTRVHADSPTTATITFEDGIVWTSQRVSGGCGCG